MGKECWFFYFVFYNIIWDSIVEIGEYWGIGGVLFVEDLGFV